MKRAFSSWKMLCGAFVFLTSGFCASGQDYKIAIGSTYTHLNELPLFRYCVVLESRVNSCNLVCRKVADTLNRKLLLVAEQMLNEKEDRRRLLDVQQIRTVYSKCTTTTIIGSLDTKEGQQNSAFLIAVELEKGKPDSNGILPAVQARSVHIFEAWQLHCRQRKFRKFPVRNLYRIHEGYYVGKPPLDSEFFLLH